MNDFQEHSQPQPGTPDLEPKSIQVFGILHLVFGFIGVFSLLMGAVQWIFHDAFLKLSASGDPDMMELQKKISESTLPATIAGLVISSIVTFFILRAGFKLVKKRKDAIAATTGYSYASIVAKVIALTLALTFTLPAINGVLEEMEAAGSSSPSLAIMIQTMKYTMAASSILTPVLTCIYPILSLVMLRKKPVRDYLDKYGK